MKLWNRNWQLLLGEISGHEVKGGGYLLVAEARPGPHIMDSPMLPDCRQHE